MALVVLLLVDVVALCNPINRLVYLRVELLELEYGCDYLGTQNMMAL